MKRCPYCAEEIQDAAIVCRYCGHDLPAEHPGKAAATKATPGSRWRSGGIIAGVVLVIAGIVGLVLMAVASWADGGLRFSLAASTPTATLTSTPTPHPTPHPTPRPAPTPTPDPCIRWDEVTPSMKGETICVRGIVTKLTQTRQVGSRYQFSDKSSTFFLFSKFWEVVDLKTGKTLGPGTCIKVTDVVEVQSGIPYVNIDNLLTRAGEEFEDFYFYDDTSACR